MTDGVAGVEVTDLVTAFRVLGPILPEPQTGDPGRAEVRAVNRQRQRAARLVYEELHALAGPFPANLRPDLVQQVLLRLVRGGPRQEPTDPDSLRRVRGYLRKSLKYAFIDRLREEQRRRKPPPSPAAVPKPEPEPGLSPEVLEEAHQLLEAKLLPAIRTRHGPGVEEVTRRSLREMFSVRGADGTIRALVARALTPDAADADWKRTRNTLYQQHSRARRRLLATGRDLRSAGELDVDEIEILEGLVRYLRGRR